MKKVAIVVDWLTTIAGAEKVLAHMLRCFPEADLFSVVDFLTDEERAQIANKHAKTSFIQRLPFAKKKYRGYLPFMPIAIEQLDVTDYDIVISSSHAVAKGIITAPEQCHISYVHSPIRYAWDLQHQYLKEAGLTRGPKSWLARLMLHKIRQWDVRTSNGVDHFVANSHYIAKRIWKVYRRKADVIYPPVNTEAFTLCKEKEDYYLAASRMVPYKRMDLIVKAFARMPDKRLIVIGDGPDMKKVSKCAGSNVTLLGYQSTDILKTHLQKAKALLFAAKEDFGIVPVEAQACGTPVIAYGKGGLSETVRGLEHEKPTGVFYHEQTEEALCEAVNTFEASAERFSPEACREQALQFSEAVFLEKFGAFVEACHAGN